MSNSKPLRSARNSGPDWRKQMGLHPDFPLFPHQNGRWAKKVRQRLKYFGKIADDPKGQRALELWNEQKDDLIAGRAPRSKTGGLEVRDLCNHFLTAKTRLLRNGEITPRTFDDYRATTDRLVKEFGPRRLVCDLTAGDFAKLRESMAKTLGFVALGNAVQRVRSVFKFGFENQLILAPAAFGSEFKPPSKKLKRRHRHERGLRLFEAADLKRLIDAAGVPLKAMILLGINAGMGNSDIAHLPIAALDLKAGWLDFPRPKTGVQRRLPLWPETVKALQAAIERRPTPKDPADAGLVFITKHGHRWDRLGRFSGDPAAVAAPESDDEPKKAKWISSNNALSKEFRQLAREQGIDRTFYDLRHTFRTVAGGARDLEATRSIMGHVNEHVEDAYIERVSDDRLRAVSDHVRAWLYPKAKAKRQTVAAKKSKQPSRRLRVVG